MAKQPKFKSHIERCDSSWSNTGKPMDLRKAASFAAIALANNTGMAKEATREVFQKLMDGAEYVEKGVYRVRLIRN